MDIISEKARNYLPYDLETRLRSVRRVVESGWSIRKALSYYKVKRTSFWRWRKRYDGTAASLADRSHQPKSDHSRKTPERTAHKIKCLANCRKRDNLSSIDIWMRLNSFDGYSASYSTVLRILKRLDGYEPYKSNPKKKHNGRYHTPDNVGEKWQMDVKFVPCECKSPKLPGGQRYYQY